MTATQSGTLERAFPPLKGSARTLHLVLSQVCLLSTGLFIASGLWIGVALMFSLGDYSFWRLSRH